MKENNSCQCHVTIDVLPDDALLYVFDFYLAVAPDLEEVESWHTLVHVCRRWRCLVFGSPRRLNLQIVCKSRTAVQEKLDVWPTLPIVVFGDCGSVSYPNSIKPALDHNDRVCKIKLFMRGHFEEVFAALEKPFPALTELSLWSFGPQQPVFPNPFKFLGGSTLRSFSLGSIPIPGLPDLLPSFSDLVSLHLAGNLHSEYISPEAVFTILSVLTKLERLSLLFGPMNYSRRRRHPPLGLSTHVVLPALTHFLFNGVSEYLEDLVALIDAPLLDHLGVTFHQIIFDNPQLRRFISHIPKWQALDKVHMAFDKNKVWIEFPSPIQVSGHGNALRLEISCYRPDLHFPRVVQFCCSPFPPFSTLEHLYIGEGRYSPQDHRDEFEYTRWLELFQPFTSVKNLYLSKLFAPRIAPALKELIEERATEALPTLQNIFLEEFELSGPVYEALGGLVAARQRSRHTIVISHWDRTG